MSFEHDFPFDSGLLNVNYGTFLPRAMYSTLKSRTNP